MKNLRAPSADQRRRPDDTPIIVDCLKQETTEAAMCKKQDAPRQDIADGVSKIPDILHSINALED